MDKLLSISGLKLIHAPFGPETDMWQLCRQILQENILKEIKTEIIWPPCCIFSFSCEFFFNEKFRISNIMPSVYAPPSVIDNDSSLVSVMI